MKAVKLTSEECSTILRALNIAQEDGSIYGGAETDAEYIEIENELDRIRKKLRS